MRKSILWMLALLLVIHYSSTEAFAQKPAQSRAQSRLMARRAAISDAQRNLAETIYGIKINSETTVRNFITENDTIRTQVLALLRGATVTDTRYEPDGTCIVTMEVPVAALQRSLQRRFAYYSDYIIAEGTGAPNPVMNVTPVKSTPSPEETWHTLVIKATGRSEISSDVEDSSQAKLMAERAAYADALRNLGENIMGVHVTAQTTVRNFVLKNDEILNRFRGFLQGARRVETRHYEDGVCEVDVEIPLNGLRGIIDQARREKSAGSDRPVIKRRQSTRNKREQIRTSEQSPTPLAEKSPLQKDVHVEEE